MRPLYLAIWDKYILQFVTIKFCNLRRIHLAVKRQIHYAIWYKFILQFGADTFCDLRQIHLFNLIQLCLQFDTCALCNLIKFTLQFETTHSFCKYIVQFYTITFSNLRQMHFAICDQQIWQFETNTFLFFETNTFINLIWM